MCLCMFGYGLLLVGLLCVLSSLFISLEKGGSNVVLVNFQNKFTYWVLISFVICIYTRDIQGKLLVDLLKIKSGNCDKLTEYKHMPSVLIFWYYPCEFISVRSWFLFIHGHGINLLFYGTWHLDRVEYRHLSVSLSLNCMIGSSGNNLLSCLSYRVVVVPVKIVTIWIV